MTALARDTYNEVAGIYIIKNKITGKLYIGSSVNLYCRINAHISKLNTNKHTSPYLQHSVNKHGLENFEVSIYEVFDDISEKELRIKEGRLIREFKTYSPKYGYNSDIDDEDGKRRHSERARNAIRKSRALVPIIGYNVETGAIKMYDAPRFCPARDSAQLIERIKSGTVLNGCYWFYDKDFTLGLLKQRFTKDTKRNNNVSTEVLDLETGIFYETQKEVAAAFNISRGAFRERLKRGFYGDRFLVTSKNSTGRKMVLNLETGVFYNSITEAAKYHNIHMSQLVTYFKTGYDYGRSIYSNLVLC